MANPATPLSATQERRLVDYLEEQFLELTRGYKKRLIPRDLSPHANSCLPFPSLEGQVAPLEQAHITPRVS